jgi:uncharacterized protein (TIGR03083 family)
VGHDYRSHLWDEVADIGGLLAELDRPEWDAPSLCDGWRVRDVVGHTEYGHTRAMGRFLVDLARYRFDVPRGSSELSIRWGTDHSPERLLAIWERELVAGQARRGVSRFVKWPDALVDHLIHHQDMRRALGRPREIPRGRLVAALDALGTIHSPIFDTRDKVRPFCLVATDVDWTSGSGPLVEGGAEALILAAGGRPAAYGELSGDGVAAFTGQVPAAG